MELKCKIYDSPVGRLVLGELDERLCMCDWAATEQMAQTRRRLQRYGIDTLLYIDTKVTCEAARQLDGYFEGRRREFDLQLRMIGTDFQQRVWRELQKVGYGERLTYGELARRIGASGASRAVGTAVGANLMSIIVPCHRIVPAGGGTGNYAGGVEAKRYLLSAEVGGDFTPEFGVPF